MTNKPTPFDAYAKEYELKYDADVTPVDVHITVDADIPEVQPLVWTTEELLAHSKQHKKIKLQQTVVTVGVCVLAAAAFVAFMGIFGMMVA